MEIIEQDIFSNSHDEEVSLLVEEKTPEVTVEAHKHQEVMPTDEDEPFELKIEEPTVRKKPAPKPVAPKKNEPMSASEVASPSDKGKSFSPSFSSPKPKKPKRSSITWRLFATFFKIGFVTFGGGYAMIPMIESEVVDKKKWVEREQFLDLIAIAQTCPGVFAINISTFIGYKLKHNFGACMAALGAALPSFIIILLIATMFTQVQDIPWVAACFRGIRPAVVALIAVPTFNLAKSAKIGLTTCWIPILGALLIYLLGVNPVFIIIAAALGGYLYGTLLKN